MIFLGRNTANNKDLDATNKKIKSSRGNVFKYIYYELRSINLYLEGVVFSASTIC